MRVQDGRIAEIGTALAAPAGATIEDGQGALLLPGLVEGHTHLDKTMWGMDWYRNEVGTSLTDKIENERAFRHASGHDAATQSLVLAKAFLALGTTRLRTHVDVDTQAGLRHLEGALRTREALRDVQQIQIVAFPQSGLLGRPGTAELLDQSLALGADVLGGLDPCAIDGDPVKSLDVLFGIADKRQRPIDIHLHEPGAMGAFSLDLILQRTEALGMQGQVAISHGFCLGDVSERERDALLARMAKLGVVLDHQRAALAHRAAAHGLPAGRRDRARRQRRHPRHLVALRQPRHARARHDHRPALQPAPRRRDRSRARRRHALRRARLRLRGLRPRARATAPTSCWSMRRRSRRPWCRGPCASWWWRAAASWRATACCRPTWRVL